MKFLFGLIFSCAGYCATGQRCATFQYQKNTVQTNASQRNGEANSLLENTRDTLPNEQITIPVIIHLLYNNNNQNISDAQILSQLDVLNKDYNKLNADAANTPAAFASLNAAIKITFCLARVDEKGRPTKGIIRKFTNTQAWLANDEMKFSNSGGDDAWDAKKYLNIWVCNLFDRTLGYSSLPGSPVEKDGVVIQYDVFGTGSATKYPYNKGRTATHEVGHWLGLKHLWGDADCGDDGITDTPTQKTYNTGCPSFPHTSTCSINSKGDLFMNYMDFSDDACMNMFTQGQKIKMRSMFALGGFRNSFLLSKVCDSSLAQGGPVAVDSTAIPTNILLYPNPAASYLIIQSNSAQVIGKSCSVFNTVGKQVLQFTMLSQKTTIAINQLPAGMYFIRIEIDGKLRTLKFLKQ